MPKYKVVNMEVIVGILTETNQFVPTIPEHTNHLTEMNGIPAIIKNNYQTNINDVENDNLLLTEQTQDTERILKVRQIRLESYFYNVFRNFYVLYCLL